MFFSWYFIGLLCVLAIAVRVFPGWYLWYVLAILLLLWLVDLWLTLKRPKLTARRGVTDPLYQDRESTVRVTITNPGKRAVKLVAKDEPPFALKAPNCQGRFWVPAGQEKWFDYSVMAPRRGVFEFGNLNLRITGNLQLFCHPVTIKMRQELRVYPNLEKIFSGRLTRLVGSDAAGSHRLKQLGMNGELAELKEYTAGDDYRKMNWKVTAHRGKLFINEYEPEKDQNVYLIFDTGRLLFDQVNQDASRLDHILDAAILLAFHIQERGDMVGALSFNCKVAAFIPVGRGNSHLQKMISQLFNMQAVMVESDYRGAFNFWQSKVNKRSLIFIYTDLLDSESSKELIDHLKILSRHHLVVCVLSRQNTLDRLADTVISDEKSAFLKGTALELLKERALLIRSLTGYGIQVLEVNPANIRQSVVDHYNYLKNRGLF
jgi:Uncharacterized conserved protein (some members contain a von Willebrand factor type A (vWA) domain)